MHAPDLIASAQRILESGRGTRPRQEFKRMLQGHQSTLSFEQWTWLLVSLEALLSTPTTVPPASAAVQKNKSDIAMDELHKNFREYIGTLMRGLLAAQTPQVHHEWLRDMELCFGQFDLACAWIERQTATVCSQSTQS